MAIRVRVAASVATIALVGAACGARVEPLGRGPYDPGIYPGAGETAGQVPGPGATTGTDPGTGPTGPGGSTGPGQPQQPSCRGGASDTGVTASTVKIGSIITITGPLPGQFNAARDAVDSYFKMVNEQGGVCGRSFQLLIRDDGGDTGNNARVARQLLDEDHVFAFVGSHSANDDGMASVLCDKPVPDIGFQLGWKHTVCKNTYGVPGQLQKRRTGGAAAGTTYLNEKYAVEQVAIFWLQESEVSILSAWSFEAVMLRAKPDLKICYEQQTGVFETGFFNYVNNMKDRCDPAAKTAVYSTMENNSNIRLAKAMDSQGFKPAVFVPTSTSYLPSFISEAEGTTEGAVLEVPQLPFERCAERGGKPVPPCTSPELARYVAAINRFHPSSPRPGSFGAGAWGQAALFVEAARSCGANLTRRCVLRHLDARPPFSANGLLSPARPGFHEIYRAGLLLRVQGGHFVEMPRPANHPGPPEAPDFWNMSKRFDWWDYYCANKGKFPNTAQKDKYIKC
ncbi:MAG: ABC transporter substrate-binding protein [Acidobacteria bacterium]|nr:ABC transporter substrate-binding protein [Acidobacteriota bacterium]